MASLFDKLKKKSENIAQGVWNQVNPFDGGKTYSNPNPQPNVPQQVQQSVQNAKYGVLANNPQAQNQFLKGIQPTKVNLFANTMTSAANAPLQVGKTIGKPFWESGDAGLAGIKAINAKFTGNQKAYNNAATNLTNSLDQSLVGGAKRFGQSVATAVNTPLMNSMLNNQQKYSDRILGKSLTTDPFTGAQDNRGNIVKQGGNYYYSGGKSATEDNSLENSYRIRNEALNKSGVNMNDSKGTLVRKIGAQGASAGLDIAFGGLAGKSLVNAPARQMLRNSAEGGVYGLTGGLAQAAQMDAPNKADYLKAGGLGLAMGTTAPVALGMAGKAGGKVKSSVKNARADSPMVAIDRERVVLQDLKASENRAKGKDKEIIRKQVFDQQQKIQDMQYRLKQGGYVKLPGKGDSAQVGKTAKGEVLYHGGDHSPSEFDVNKAYPSGLYGKAMYLTKDANRAKSYGSSVSELELPKNAKLAKSKDFENLVNSIIPTVKYGDITIARAKAVEQLKSEGYVGVREVNRQNGDTVAIFDPSVLKSTTPVEVGKTPKTQKPQKGQELQPDPTQLQAPLEVQRKTNVLSGPEQRVSGSQNSPDISLNTSRYEVNNQTKAGLEQAIKDATPDIEAKVGKKLTNKEVREYADITDKVLNSGKTRQATMDQAAAYVNATDRVAALQQKVSSGQPISAAEQQELQKLLLNVKAKQFEIGRMMNAFKQSATPKEKTMIDVMMERLVKKGHDVGELTTALEKYDLSDPAQATRFFRDFEKATAEDWLDKFRYTNMLSSPSTHITNLSSNAMGVAGVAPVQKVYEGAVDSVRSALTGKERTRYSGEALSYVKGAWDSLGDAGKAFSDVMHNRTLTGNPDMDSLRNIPLAHDGFKGFADKVLTVVPKMLEASDQFFTTVAKGGELKGLQKRASKGVEVINPEKMAQDKATYRLFRSDLGSKDQGYLLNAMDAVPNAVAKWRQAENPVIRVASKFVFPFVKTPVNILKQGIEYTPVGITTLAGHSDKTGQVAKMAMGMTTMGVVGGILAAGGDLTFGEPSNANERNQFRADGKQPYAVRIPGTNKWVSYQKMHPAIAFNFALIAGVKDALDNKKLTDSQADVILESGANMLQFFTDQSYMKNVGDFTNAISGKDGGTLAGAVVSQVGNAASQMVAFKGMLSWLNRMIDPTQRKVDPDANIFERIYQQATKDVPFLDNATPARLGPDGTPIQNQNPIFNNFSPVKVTSDISSENSKTPSAQLRNSIADKKNDLKSAQLSAQKQFGMSGKKEEEIKLLAKEGDKNAKDYLDNIEAMKKAFGDKPEPIVGKDGKPIDSVAQSIIDKKSKLTTDGYRSWSEVTYDKPESAPVEVRTATDTVNKWLPEGAPKLNPNNKIAELWADYEQKRVEGKLSPIEINKTKRSIIKEAYKTSIDKDTQAIFGASAGDIKQAYADGTISKDQLQKAIELDNTFVKYGLGAQEFSNKTRAALGFAPAPSGSGGGSGKGGKSKLPKYTTLPPIVGNTFVKAPAVKKAVYKGKKSAKRVVKSVKK